MRVLEIRTKRALPSPLPKRTGSRNEPKEIVLSLSEAIVIEPTKNDWWINYAATQ